MNRIMNRCYGIGQIALAIVLLPVYCTAQQKIVLPDHHLLRTEGRIGFPGNGQAEIYWPGSSFTARFKGTGVTAILKDQRGDNYFNVIIDNDSVRSFRIDTVKKEYTLAAGLSPGEHTVQLYRLTDWNDGVATFYGFRFDAGTKLLTVPAKKRTIEFYGNSITVGAGMFERKSPGWIGTHTNNYLSYGALTARHYNAGYSCIALSGIGLMVSWGSLIMPEMVNRLNPFQPESVWDFSKLTPDIVVVNLLQNDAALVHMPDHSQFKRRFGTTAPTEDTIIDSYKRFIQTIRHHYPKAYIICTLGSMGAVAPGSPWPGYIERSVSALHDPKIYTHFYTYINVDRHPNAAEHAEMARSLEAFIDSHIKW